MIFILDIPADYVTVYITATEQERKQNENRIRARTQNRPTKGYWIVSTDARASELIKGFADNYDVKIVSFEREVYGWIFKRERVTFKVSARGDDLYDFLKMVEYAMENNNG